MAFSLLRRLPTLSSRYFHRASLAILVAAALLSAGCTPKPVAPVKITDPKDPKFIVAEKDGWVVTRAELDKQVKSFMDQKHITPEIVGAKLPALESMMLDNMILKKLILDKAAALKVNAEDLAKEEATQLTNAKGPDSDEVFAKKLKDNGLTLEELKKLIHEKLLVGKVIEAEALTNVEPSEEEINDIYTKNKQHFVTPPKVRASNILVHVDEKATPEDKAKAKKKIDKAYARVKGGEAFSKVATEMSEDASSAPKGGDLNYHQKGENEPQFDEVAFATKEGKVSAVFESPAGYQFIKVTGIQPEGQLALSDVRPYIVKRLKDMKSEQAERTFAEKLLKDSKVNVYIVRIDPNAPPAGAPGPVPEGGPAPAPGTAPAPGAGPAPVPEPPATPAPAPEAPAAATPPAPSVPPKH